MSHGKVGCVHVDSAWLLQLHHDWWQGTTTTTTTRQITSNTSRFNSSMAACCSLISADGSSYSTRMSIAERSTSEAIHDLHLEIKVHTWPCCLFRRTRRKRRGQKPAHTSSIQAFSTTAFVWFKLQMDSNLQQGILVCSILTQQVWFLQLFKATSK